MAVYVMTGGSNANVVFHTDATCDTNHTSGLSDGSTTSIRHITHDANDKIKLNQFVSGTGIPANAYVAAINNSTCFTLSADPTATNTNTTLSFSSVNTTLGNSAHNVNFDTPTNPIIHNTDTDVDEYISAEIRTDNSTGTEMVKQSITINCNTTSGSATVTHDGLNTITTGTAVSGTGISGGTTVSSIKSPTVFELSATATATNTNVSLTFDGYNMYHNNLEATAGYRVKCYDNTNGEGTRLNSINLTTHDYFILLHADDNAQHHFAKITALKTDDVSGDALEFTPKLGNELPKGTKFSVFKGPSVSDTSVVAITAGLLVDSNTVHNYSLVCSRPLFYFYNDRLNKKNELDHNIKYKLCYNKEKDTTAITLTDTTSVFITQPDYGLQIVDKSKYGLHVEIIDNRRKADDPRLFSTVYTDANSGSANTFTNYDTCFHNARREAGDDTEATNVDRDRTGPYTYLHYEDSPMKINNPISLFSSKSYDSLGNRSAFSESKFVDTNRILSSKFQEGDNYAIRSKLKEGRISQWFELPITISTISNHITTFNIPNNYDLRLLFGYNEEIKMGNYIGTISNIAAPNYTTMTQQITLNSHYRLDTASTFSSLSANPASVDDVGYRRTWSPATRTFMIDFTLQTEVSYTFSSGLNDHPISTDDFTYKMNNVTLASYAESRLYNGYLVFGDTNYELLESRVLFDDRIHSYLRLEPPRNHYRTVSDIRTSYDYLFGVFALELEIFTGTIEEIKNYLENSAPIFEVSGRDNVSKLISPIVNKNTLYTQDMIYSHISPLRKIIKITETGGRDVKFSDNHEINDVPTTNPQTLNYSPLNLSVGDYLFNEDGILLGEIATVSGAIISLTNGLINKVSSSDVLYKQSSKPYVFTKSSLSSSKNSESFSSLSGASNRGVFFTSGVSLDSSGDKSATLTGTSSNTNINAVGNHLNAIEKIKNDGAFQAVLKDEYGGNTFTSDIVNALSDFIVLSIDKEDENTTIRLAPRVPLFLGRVDDFDHYDSSDMSTSDTEMTISDASSNVPYLKTQSNSPAGKLDTEFKRNEPVYLEDSGGNITFAGYFIRGIPPEATTTTGSNHIFILLDREVSSSVGDKIHKLNTKDTVGMYFLNRPTNHIIQLCSNVMHPTNGLLPFNVDTVAQRVSDSTYYNNYGMPLYKIIDIEQGQYEIIDEYPKINTTLNNEDKADIYYNNPSKNNVFALAYRFNAGYINSPTLTNSYEETTTHTLASDIQGFFEKRGNRPSRGTNFGDFYLSNTGFVPLFINRINGPTFSGADDILERTWERTLRMMDAKVSRNFLFVSSDLLPCTSKRKDSLFRAGRDIKDFNIMLRTKGDVSNISQTHTKALGGGFSISNSDKNTTIAAINSAPDISSLKRFSMLRLVEMTLDWHFNSVDCENMPPIDKTATLFAVNKLADAKKIQDASSNNLTIHSYPTSSTIKLSAAVGAGKLGTGKYDIYTTKGYYVGEMASFSGDTLTFTAGKGPFVNNDYEKKTGIELYAIYVDTSASNIDDAKEQEVKISGHSDFDSIVKMPASTSFHMFKGAVINNSNNPANFLGYAENDGTDSAPNDNNDEYHATYLPANSTRSANKFSMVDLLHSRDRDAEIMLPPTFPSIAATKADLTHGGGTCHLSSGTANTITLNHAPSAGLLQDGVQYHLFIKDTGDYLGKMASTHTQGSSPSTSLPMESSYVRTVTATNVDVQFSNTPNISLISPMGNTHVSEVIRAMAKTTNRKLFKETLMVSLDRYDIEDGGQAKVSAGLVSSEIKDSIQVDGNMVGKSAIQPHKILLETAHNHFGDYKSSQTLSVSTDGASPYLADGAYMLFKPFLRIRDNTNPTQNNLYTGSPSSVEVFTNGSDCLEIIFEVENLSTNTSAGLTDNQWLNFGPNLTGCYLVSNKGNPYGNKDSADNVYFNSSPTAEDTIISFADKIPNKIHYIVSHTINRTVTTNRHHLVIDNASSISVVDDVYRVMRVAENTFYNFSPKEIIPYVPSSRYTKKAFSDEMYSKLKSYQFLDKSHSKTIEEDRGAGSSEYSATGFNEAICSMYVIADPDGQGSGNHLVYRQPSDVFGASNLLDNEDFTTVAINDTKNTIQSSLQIRYNSTNRIHEMKFSEMGSMIGATSIGEIFTITTIENIKGNYTDAHIGSTVNVAYESDTLLNDLFEDEGLTFTEQDNTQYPLFISPEFKGTDLMAAANFILERKNKALVYNNGFYLRDNESRLFKPNIFITETDENYDIKSVSIGKNLFSLHNEIIVYGRNLKSVRKNLRSIKKYGKKSLTLRDENLYTQYDVDRRASRLLRLHSRPSNRVILEVKGNDVFLVKGGDVISLEITSQNIRRRNYLVIEKEYSLDGFTKLVLGEASKNMEDRFSELLVENKKIGASLRPKTFKEPSVSTDIFDSFKIKEIRIKVRKRATGGGSFTLGFSTALNIGDIPMGFDSGASIVYTDLFEEELT